MYLTPVGVTENSLQSCKISKLLTDGQFLFNCVLLDNIVLSQSPLFGDLTFYQSVLLLLCHRIRLEKQKIDIYVFASLRPKALSDARD